MCKLKDDFDQRKSLNYSFGIETGRKGLKWFQWNHCSWAGITNHLWKFKSASERWLQFCCNARLVPVLGSRAASTHHHSSPFIIHLYRELYLCKVLCVAPCCSVWVLQESQHQGAVPGKDPEGPDEEPAIWERQADRGALRLGHCSQRARL